MCLGVPGQVVRVKKNPQGMAMGTVSFGGIRKEVCLAYVPDVEVGEYVIVHAGFAISKLDEREAEETFKLLQEMDDLAELDVPQPGETP